MCAYYHARYVSLLRRLHEYDNKSSFFGGVPPLSQKVGYPLVCLLALFFTVFTIILVQIDKKWGKTK